MLAKKVAKISKKQNPNEVDNKILLVILAILLPWLAVLLYKGVGTQFWISLLLWFLFVLPGIIYALLVVLDVI
ncbi:MAG: YqaE/Pmp3 family membrane protein [Bacteroidia bacterium]|nr:YqaE/Pmp3 family membrane protein [Bacteroidia bacterium]